MDSQNTQQQDAQPAQPQAAASENVDIGKRTLIMLVMLSCIISVVGTVAMVYELSSAHQAPTIVQGSKDVSAKASLTIGAPQPSVEASTGFVTFKINKGD